VQLFSARHLLGVLAASVLAAFSLAAYATVGVNKSFTPNSVVAGQSSTLTIVLLNPNAAAATGVSLTDTLPNGVTVANPLNVATNTCGFSTAAIVPGTRPIPLSGGTIPAISGGTPGQCSITIDVVSATPNTYLNTIAAGSVASSQGSNSQDAQATLVVSAPLNITGSKAFVPTNVHGNGPISRLTITLTNPNAIALTNAAITDSLPANVTVGGGGGAGANPATNCVGGTATASAAATSPATIALTGGTIPANGSCTLAVDVVARNPNALVNGNQTNTIAAGALTTTQGVTSPAISANINVQTGGSVAKAFAPTPIAPNGASTLTVTVTNFNSTALTPITFTDTFPAAITATALPVSTCGGVVTALPVGGPPFTSFTLTGGSLAGVAGAGAGSTTCTITAPVTATATATNTIPANNYGGVVIAAASGTLSVSAITGSKSFTVPAIQTGSTTMTITLNNLTGSAATITAFADNINTMGAGFTVSGAVANTCGMTLTAPVGGTTITAIAPFTGSIAAGSSCTVTVPIAISATAATGNRTNTIAANAIHTSVGNNTVAITGVVNVQRALTMSKAFNPATVQGGAVSRLTVTLAPTVNLTGVSFTDDLTTMGAGFVVAPVPNAVLTNCGGAVPNAVAGATSFGINTGTGTLTAGSNCTFAVNIATPGGSTGTFTNTIPAANFITNEGVTTAITTANLVLVNNSVTINKSFSPTTVAVGNTTAGNPNFSTLSIQIRNNNAGAINLTGVSLSDALPQVGAFGMVVANPPTASFSGAGCSGAVITAPVGATSISMTGANVNANSICTLSVRVVGTISGNLINTVNAGALSSTQGVSNPLQGTATLAVTGTVNLTVTKTDGVVSVVPGTNTTYTITVSNAGPNAVTGLGVNDTPPAGMTFTSWTCAATAGSSCPASGSGPIAALVSILNGGNVSFTVTAAIASSATGSIANTVSLAVPGSVIDTNPTTSATDTDTLTPHADLSITKTDGSATAVPGTPITYTIVASNAGPSDAPGATVADSFPAAITSVNWTCVASAGSSCPPSGSGNINTLVNLIAGGSATFTVTGTISTTALGTLSNTATITAPAGVTDTNPANNSATDTDNLTPQADLAITKTDGVASVNAGGSTTYTIVASNNGPSAVTGATVADTAPAFLTFGSWTCVASAGSSCPATGSGNISASVNLLVGGTATFTVPATVAGGASGTISNTATISVPAGVVDLVPGNNSATDSDTVTPVADLAITKTDGVTSVNAGGSTVYTIVASNGGPSSVTGATVTDAAPAGLTFGSWTCAASAGSSCPASGSGNISASINLLAGGTATFTLNATVAGNATGTLSNTATVAVPIGVTDPNSTNNSATDSDTVTLVADLSITKDDGKASVVPGTSNTYTIVVTNSGPSAVTGATVSDILPAALTNVTYTAVASGGATGFTASGSGNINDTVNMPASSTITYTVVTTVSANATGSVSNTATVTAPSGVTDNNPANNSATDTDTLTPQADLSITKTDGVTSVNAGGNTTYTIVVTNNGPSSANGAIFTDPAVSNLNVTSVTCGSPVNGAACPAPASTTVALMQGAGIVIPTLPPTGSVTFTVNATVAGGATGSIANVANIAAPSGVTDPTPGNNSATDTDTVNLVADLAITKDDGKTSVNAGASTSYTIVVTNNGPSAANNAVFTDPAVSNLNVTSVTCGNPQNGAACPLPASTTVALMQGAGIVIPTLPATGSVTFTVNATVAGSATGSIANTASIAAPSGVTDPTSGNNSATDTDTVNLVADLSITKDDGKASVVPGTSNTYTIVVSNAGPSAVTGATVSDVLPAALTNVTYTAVASGGATGFTASGSGNINDTVNMPASSTITYTVVTTVSANATGSLSNTATVTAPSGVTDNNPANNSATDTDTLTPQADLSITKTDGVTTAVPGNSTTYTIVVTNNGPSAVTGATVSDTMPAEIASDNYTAVASGGAAGFTASGSGNIADTVNMPVGSTITYTVVTQIDSGATGTLSNTATVTAPSGVTDTNPGNNSATDSDTLTPQVDLQVTKTDGSSSYTPGGSATYTVTIINNGPSDAKNVTLTDNFPAGLTLSADASCVANGNANCGAVTGLVGETAFGTTGATVGASIGDSLVFTAPVAFASGMTTNPLDNKATATDIDTGNTDSDTDSDTLAPSVSLSVFKTDGSLTYTPGGTATYTITITDTGLSDATNVTVTDNLPAGVSLSANASCVANGTASCGTVTGTTGQTSLGTTGATVPIGAGNSIVLSASVSFAPGMTTDPLDNKADATDVLSGATGSSTDSDALALGVSLSVTKTDNSPTYVPGGTATYAITVKNTGLSDATNVTVSDNLPLGVTLTGNASCAPQGTATCGTVTGTTGQATLGTTGATIPAGAANALVFTAPVAFAASLVDDPLINSASASDGPSGASGSGSDSDGKNATADLAITKSDGVTTAVPGQSVTYTITVTNSGPSDVTGATVADTFPAAIASATWTCVPSGGGTCTASGSGNINDTVNLPVGAVLTYTVTASIAASATGSLSNTATVAAPSGVTDSNPGNNSATDTDTLTPQADLSITKTDGVTTVNPGQSVTYTIVATNNGPSAVTGATVSDALPATLTGANWTCAASAGSSCPASGPGNINASVDLLVGGTATFTLNATVSGSASGSISNTAVVTAPAGVTDTNPANNSATDTDTVVIILLPDLTVAKSHSGGFFAGQIGAIYTITVSNVGTAASSGLVGVVDTLPAGLTATSIAGPGWSCSLGTLTCTRSDALLGGSSYPAITLTVNVNAAVGSTLINNVTVSGGGDPNGGNNSASDSVTVSAARVAPTAVPTLDFWLLCLLALLVAGGATVRRRR
jgi:uncharacterized repeat protein (TIGR01451 family)